MTWDWSTAGKLDADGKPIVIKDAKGHVTYDSRKGDFALAENVKPEYIWFNGKVNYTLLERQDREDRRADRRINRLGGSPTDGKSMIWPIKVFRGKQPYDPVNKTLVTPHTAGNDDTAYWKNFDWDKAIAAGMADVRRAVLRQGRFRRDRDVPGRSPTWWRPRTRRSACVECHARRRPPGRHRRHLHARPRAPSR